MSIMQPFQSKKRLRDLDDSESSDERSEKKQRSGHSFKSFPAYALPQVQTLPFRSTDNDTILLSNGQVMAMTITPTNSDGSKNNSPTEALSSPHLWPYFHRNDMDMEQDDLDMTGSQPPESPFIPSLRPAKLNPQLFQDPAVVSRIPTPIHSSFHPRTAPAPRSETSPMVYDEGASSNGLQWKLPDRNRRMPSPISEDGFEPQTPTAITESQLSRLSVNTSGLEGMDVDIGGDDTPTGYLPTPTTQRKTRARSGAITEKRRFAMGYRDDCEKCRARVPGHYSHFLPA